MSDTITITGLVATTPRHILTSTGLSITSFRLASAQRRFDRSQERWIDVETNWYTITTFRQLALNCSTSVMKGQRVVVTGKLRIREWDNGERVGTTVEVEADSVGHDLLWGTSTFTRSIVSSSATATPAPSSDGDTDVSPEVAPDADPNPERAVTEEEREIASDLVEQAGVPF